MNLPEGSDGVSESECIMLYGHDEQRFGTPDPKACAGCQAAGSPEPELVTGRRILEIIKPESQKAIKVRPDRKGIRFDVYFEDEEGVAYDIEMQNKSERDLGRRMRYYGGVRDVDLLRSGGKYKNLEDSYIVFICTYNPFSKGLHKYTFETRCVEDTGLVLEDGLHKIMLCSEGRADDVSNSMKEFLAFVGGAEPNSDFTRRIEELPVYYK